MESADPPDRTCDELATAVPEDPSKPYDVHGVIESLLDDGDFMEVHAGWARNITVGFGRMNGGVVGIVANNPAHLAGVLDSTPRARPRVSFVSATASTSRS